MPHKCGLHSQLPHTIEDLNTLSTEVTQYTLSVELLQSPNVSSTLTLSKNMQVCDLRGLSKYKVYYDNSNNSSNLPKLPQAPIYKLPRKMAVTLFNHFLSLALNGLQRLVSDRHRPDPLSCRPDPSSTVRTLAPGVRTLWCNFGFCTRRSEPFVPKVRTIRTVRTLCLPSGPFLQFCRKPFPTGSDLSQWSEPLGIRQQTSSYIYTYEMQGSISLI